MAITEFPQSHPFDDDKLREECGVFGVLGMSDAASFVTLGLHALQHRGQEAGGIVAYSTPYGFNSARRFGYVRDNFTSKTLMDSLPGSLSIGHVRYSTAGSKHAAIRDVQHDGQEIDRCARFYGHASIGAWPFGRRLGA